MGTLKNKLFSNADDAENVLQHTPSTYSHDSHAVMQSCSHAVMQSCSHAVMQSYSHTVQSQHARESACEKMKEEEESGGGGEESRKEERWSGDQ